MLERWLFGILALINMVSVGVGVFFWFHFGPLDRHLHASYILICALTSLLMLFLMMQA